MQATYKNKRMEGPETAKTAQDEYFFPGGGEYKPMSIMAQDLESATKEWEQNREKTN